MRCDFFIAMNPIFLIFLLSAASAMIEEDPEAVWYQNRTEVANETVLFVLSVFEKDRIAPSGLNDFVFIPRFLRPVIDLFADVSHFK
jgi:hypothetical protein